MAARGNNSKRRTRIPRWREPHVERLEPRTLFAAGTGQLALLDVAQFTQLHLSELHTEESVPVCSARVGTVGEEGTQFDPWSQWGMLEIFQADALVPDANGIEDELTFQPQVLDCDRLPRVSEVDLVFVNAYSTRAQDQFAGTASLEFGLLQGPAIANQPETTPPDSPTDVDGFDDVGTTELPPIGGAPDGGQPNFEVPESPVSNEGPSPALPPLTPQPGPGTPIGPVLPAAKLPPPVLLDIGGTVVDRSQRSLEMLRSDPSSLPPSDEVGGFRYFQTDTDGIWNARHEPAAAHARLKYASRDHFFAFMLDERPSSSSLVAGLASDDSTVDVSQPVAEPQAGEAADVVASRTASRGRGISRQEVSERIRALEQRAASLLTSSQTAGGPAAAPSSSRGTLLQMVAPMLTWFISARPQSRSDDQASAQPEDAASAAAAVQVAAETPKETSTRRRSIAGSVLFVSLITARQVLRSQADSSDEGAKDAKLVTRQTRTSDDMPKSSL